MRLLNVEKRMSANSPGTSLIAPHAPRTSMIGWPSATCGLSSGMRRKSRCAKASAVAPIAMNRVGPMPRMPIDSPENTLVTMNARPCTVPTSPLAFACRSSGISRVTVVDSAMLRMFSITPPNRMMPANSQNHGPPRSSNALSGCNR